MTSSLSPSFNAICRSSLRGTTRPLCSTTTCVARHPDDSRKSEIEQGRLIVLRSPFAVTVTVSAFIQRRFPILPYWVVAFPLQDCGHLLRRAAVGDLKLHRRVFAFGFDDWQ